MAQATQTNTISPPTLFVALELSKKTWKLGFTTSRTRKPRIRDVQAGDRAGFIREVGAAKRSLALPAGTPVKSCYEAGRDGFWLHRWLAAEGIQNVVLEPASIPVDRRSRQVKTDRLDVQKLAHLLARHHDGEGVVRVVRVPPAEAEDERLLPRQLRSLKNALTRATNAIRGALMRHGIDLDPRRKNFPDELAAARQWNGERLPPGLQQEVALLYEQCALLTKQIKGLAQKQTVALREARREPVNKTQALQKAAFLSRLKGIGDTGAYVLATEFFAWREFKNRGEVGALAGLTGTPFCSGSENRDQGISKAGNPRVRALMIELAWCWLRFQPNSRTSRWYHEHIGKGGKRSKRKAIVAVARKLLVELWHFVEHGVVPVGAELKDLDRAAKQVA